MSMGPKRIIAIGDMVVDILLPPLPDLPKGDRQLLLDGLELSPGGNTLNFALAASAFGGSVEFHGVRGDDALGAWLSSWLTRSFAENRTRAVQGGRTAATVAIPDSSGRRRLLTYPGTNAYLKVAPTDLTLQGAFHLHMGGYWFLTSMAGRPSIDLFEACRKSGVETSMDPATAPGGWNGPVVDGLRSMMGLIDILFLNEEELAGLSGDGDIDAAAGGLMDLGLGKLVLHRAEKGASIFTKAKRYDIGALPVHRPLNPTGCGDVLNGSYVAARAQGRSDLESLRLGVRAASIHLSCRKPHYPDMAEAERAGIQGDASQY